MKRFLFIVLLMSGVCHLKAQFTDDFSDGEIMTNPAWEGDVDDFVVNEDLSLQLDAPEAGNSALYLNSFFPDSVEWNLLFNMDFAPSGSNRLRIYLMASDFDLSNTNGYFLEIGESGSSDALYFYRQNGNEENLLASGTMGALGNAPADARLQILRHGNGFWEIKADYDSGNTPQTEMEFFDDSFTTGQDYYFILHCQYTDSRKDRFFFDDISMQEIVPDTEAPVLTDIEVLSSSEIQLTFNEPLDVSSAENTTNYSINPNLDINLAQYSGQFPYRVVLQLSQEIESGVIYKLFVINIEDLKGNRLIGGEFEFKLLEQAEPGDLIVNEILFDPFQDAEDFVEIYNRSQKFISLDDVLIVNQDKSEETQIQSGLEIWPGSYLAFSPDTEALEDHYILMNPEAIIRQDLPSFNNESGNCSLIRKDGIELLALDSMDYTEDQHYVLIDDTEGVSLERINPLGNSSDPQNWHSAAGNIGFATPGYQNSQFFEGNSTMEAAFSLAKKVFSPNADGYDDLLLIEYSLENPGFVANMKVFNARGRFVKNLTRNELLATTGLIKWDGTTEENSLADLGIYIIWVELFHPDGNTEQFTMDCVLAQSLN